MLCSAGSAGTEAANRRPAVCKMQGNAGAGRSSGSYKGPATAKSSSLPGQSCAGRASQLCWRRVQRCAFDLCKRTNVQRVALKTEIYLPRCPPSMVLQCVKCFAGQGIRDQQHALEQGSCSTRPNQAAADTQRPGSETHRQQRYPGIAPKQKAVSPGMVCPFVRPDLDSPTPPIDRAGQQQRIQQFARRCRSAYCGSAEQFRKDKHEELLAQHRSRTRAVSTTHSPRKVCLKEAERQRAAHGLPPSIWARREAQRPSSVSLREKSAAGQ